MTPEEKAKELVKKFEPYCEYEIGQIHQQITHAKQCALICCEEVIKGLNNADAVFDEQSDGGYIPTQIEFWKSVKTEINKL